MIPLEAPPRCFSRPLPKEKSPSPRTSTEGVPTSASYRATRLLRADAGAAGGLDVPDLTFGDDAGTSSTCPAFSVSDAQLYETAFFNRYVRGARTSTSATSATADNLTNGVPYRCVVVAEDNAGNRSVSTSSQCVIPLPVTDFWERYRQSGGAAQPIGCGARPGARTGALLACISLVATAVALMGRRRRKP